LAAMRAAISPPLWNRVSPSDFIGLPSYLVSSIVLVIVLVLVRS
jgi:hypothetical protein